MQGETERLQQQQAERERQKAVAIEERQRMEEHQKNYLGRLPEPCLNETAAHERHIT